MTDLEKDKQYLKNLAKKYGNEVVYELINETSYSFGDNPSGMVNGTFYHDLLPRQLNVVKKTHFNIRHPN